MRPRRQLGSGWAGLRRCRGPSLSGFSGSVPAATRYGRSPRASTATRWRRRRAASDGARRRCGTCCSGRRSPEACVSQGGPPPRSVQSVWGLFGSIKLNELATSCRDSPLYTPSRCQRRLGARTSTSPNRPFGACSSATESRTVIVVSEASQGEGSALGGRYERLLAVGSVIGVVALDSGNLECSSV